MIKENKLRGGYYTPEPICEFMTDWILRGKPQTILEPSCGDGNFLAAIAAHSSSASMRVRVVGVEVNADEADKARARCAGSGNRINVVNQDFFAWAASQLDKGKEYNAVIGNPPFIRYQNFPPEQRDLALDLMRDVGLNPNKLTNIWVPFVVAAARLLAPTGRMAFVLPAELLQVGYAAELRKHLIDEFHRITMVTFRKLVFPEIQQEVVLLLAEKCPESGEEGLRVLELENGSELADLEGHISADTPLKPIDHTRDKWTQYFLESDDILLLRRFHNHPELRTLGEILSVDVGIVTGRNKFFVLTEEDVGTRKLDRFVIPLVGRSTHLKGIQFDQNDWEASLSANAAGHLLLVGSDEVSQSSALQAYIAKGEDEGIHTGYKCRIRKPWYTVPGVRESDGFMLRQVHKYPKLVMNASGAVCTDTIHRTQMLNGEDPDKVTAAFLNSLTFAFAETMGRSYGGGVLELEPREAEGLPLPSSGWDKLNPEWINQMVRQDDIEEVLDHVDQATLVEGMGLSWAEVRRLRGIWALLRDRRLNRTKA